MDVPSRLVLRAVGALLSLAIGGCDPSSEWEGAARLELRGPLVPLLTWRPVTLVDCSANPAADSTFHCGRSGNGRTIVVDISRDSTVVYAMEIRSVAIDSGQIAFSTSERRLVGSLGAGVRCAEHHRVWSGRDTIHAALGLTSDSERPGRSTLVEVIANSRTRTGPDSTIWCEGLRPAP